MYLPLSYLLSGYIQKITVFISYICDTVQKKERESWSKLQSIEI